MAISYKDSGVDVTQGQLAVKKMRQSVEATFNENVLEGLGSFAGFFKLPQGLEEPVLVSGTDGVGTKILLLQELNAMEKVGQDLVAMCVNDVLCHGAKPLFFLDYLATGKLNPDTISSVVKSVADACKMTGTALIGGETAEMPGLYDENEIDMAGFAVGIIDKKKIINGSTIKAGDVIIGIESSGFHSNGYSLVRKIFLDVHRDKLEKYRDRLVRPTHLYHEPVLNSIETGFVKGIAHITGGGFYENIPRILPKGLTFDIKLGSWERDPMFEDIKELTELDDFELYSTFNMGIGMVFVTSKEHVSKVMEVIKSTGFKCFEIGTVEPGEEGILR
ncbi:phosphoribosylformylglycinamidine cyclo-ligase [Guggenheimella bovis]